MTTPFASLAAARKSADRLDRRSRIWEILNAVTISVGMSSFLICTGEIFEWVMAGSPGSDLKMYGAGAVFVVDVFAVWAGHARLSRLEETAKGLFLGSEWQVAGGRLGKTVKVKDYGRRLKLAFDDGMQATFGLKDLQVPAAAAKQA